MEQVVDNKQVIFKGYIEGAPKETDMEIKMSKVELKSPKGSGAILVKNLYLSCDPYMKGRMRRSGSSYISSLVPGQAIEGFGVAKVLDSDNPNFRPGDLVAGLIGWEEYSLIWKMEQLRKIQPDDQIPHTMSVFLVVIELGTLDSFRSCGSTCCLTCQVVGNAGSNHKVDLLKNKLGFDEAFNYNDESNLDEALRRFFPQGIDIYFDNVGGEMLDAALFNMNDHGELRFVEW